VLGLSICSLVGMLEVRFSRRLVGLPWCHRYIVANLNSVLHRWITSSRYLELVFVFEVTLRKYWVEGNYFLNFHK